MSAPVGQPPARRPTARRIGCAHCDWTVTAWRTSRDGRKTSGIGSLIRHMEVFHTEELQALQDRILEVCGPEESEDT